MSSNSSRPAIPLRRSLELRVGTLVCSAAILVGAGYYEFSLQPMAAQIAEEQFTAAAAELEAGMDGVFQPAEQILKMSRGWLQQRPPDIDSADEFNRIFQPVLQTLPQATSIVAGTSVGEGWMLLQRPDGGWTNRLTDLRRWGNDHLFFEREAGGRSMRSWKTLDYDPRQRAWYKAAIAQREDVRWTDPYTFYTTGDPGITGALAFSLRDGRDFVVGVDLKLRDLSIITMSAHVGVRGMAAVLTDDLRVLGLPAPSESSVDARWLEEVLKPARELPLPALAAALDAWEESSRKGTVSFVAEGERWLARFHSHELGDRKLWIATLAPESDFVPNWLSVVGPLLGALALALASVLLFSRRQAGSIARPLEELVLASDRIGHLDFHAVAIDKVEFAEIGQLAAAYERMRQLLEDDQHQIAAQREALHNQISALRATEDKLRESETHYRLLSENVSDIIWKLDRNFCFTYVSPADERLRGFSADEVIGRHVLTMMTEEGVAAVKERVRQRLSDNERQHDDEPITIIAQQRCKDGRLIWTESLVTVGRAPDGPVTGYYGITRDITERRKAEEDLRASENRLFTILENVDACIYLKDMQGKYLFANRAVRDLLQLKEATDIVGHGDERFFSDATAANIRRNDVRVLLGGETVRAEENNLVSATGERRIYQSTKLPLRRENGEIYALCGISTDITELKEHESQLKHIAHYDTLTTLPNRVLLADRLHQAMVQSTRHGKPLAVVYLDLDGFKAINDRYGHQTGDQLLVVLASRMKKALREGDTLARLGGDEFIAVLLDLPDMAASEPMLIRLLSAAAQPVSIGDVSMQVSASLGITTYPQLEDVDADQLLRQADQAMYQAKLAGKNRYHIFDAEQDRTVRGHHESVERIRRALGEREFVLRYQPKVNMRTGKVIGVEALIRWQHPERGLIPPADFLPVIENHPLAVDIGDWVIDTALGQCEAWRAEGLDVPISVNVGAYQLQHADFLERLERILAAHPSIGKGVLEMEVLETSALEDLARVSEVIAACRQLGVTFSLDDFGTGYSSLTYLKRLSVNLLKIDQSFVRDMLDDPDDLAILVGVLTLATTFRRQAIAEGVETVEHGRMLLQLGCELAQGYGIARPMPGEDIPRWAASWRPDSVWSTAKTVSRDDLPLLFSGVEHRAWITALGAFFCGERDDLPGISSECRFTTWLEFEGRSRHGHKATFAQLTEVHRRMHDLGADALRLHSQGHTGQAMEELDRLHGLHEEFARKLHALVSGRAASGKPADGASG